MTEDIQPTNSASPIIAGRHWPCLCGKPEHSVFLPADVEPEGRHGTFYDIVGGRHTQTTYWRLAADRCAKAIGSAPVASVQKAKRPQSEPKPERAVEPVREAGAA
jgi:hypothetical protein